MTVVLADAEKIKVHFVPHSHMDAGWLKTFDFYYNHKVKKILSNIVEQLSSDSEGYHYSLGDIGFFRHYYYK